MTTTTIMTGIRQVKLVNRSQPTEQALRLAQDERYRVALRLVDRIDEGVTTGNHHYWTKAGALLVKLDQVVAAILRDELL